MPEFKVLRTLKRGVLPDEEGNPPTEGSTVNVDDADLAQAMVARGWIAPVGGEPEIKGKPKAPAVQGTPKKADAAKNPPAQDQAKTK